MDVVEVSGDKALEAICRLLLEKCVFFFGGGRNEVVAGSGCSRLMIGLLNQVSPTQR